MSNGSEERSEHAQELHGSPSTPLMTPQEQAIDEFWRRQEDIENLMNCNCHNLPMANIEEIIRANLGSLMTSSDTPPFVTKLCELVIQELAIRAWMCASSHGRFTILESDITEAINSTKPYIFLNGVLQRHGTNHDQESASSNTSQLLQETQFLAASYESTKTATSTTVTHLAGHGKVVDGDHQNIVVQKCPENYDCTSGSNIHSTKDTVASESTLHKLVEENSQFPEDNHGLTSRNALEIKNGEDLNNMSTTSSGGTKETK